MQNSLYLALLLPLFGALACGLLHAMGPRPVAGKAAGLVANLAAWAAFALALRLFLQREPEGLLIAPGMAWIQAGWVKVGFDLRLDSLSALMLLVVTGVSALVQLYSLGSMGGERSAARFFAYLGLLTFATVLLVLGDNLLILLAGLQGVGLMSWLLIGFRSDADQTPTPSQAGLKAFIVNRIGDAALLVGAFLLLVHCGTLDYGGLQEKIAAGALAAGAVLGDRLALVTALCLFVGAACKAAQIPFSVWLHDVHAAPAAASALIQSVSVGLGGVYLVARTAFLFAQSPGALAVVALVGALTAVLAAAMAMAQRDLRRILALSTASQLGLMFLACGVGASSAALSHAATHGLSKALLVLGLAAILSSARERFRSQGSGGLFRRMPITCGALLVGALSLAGLPPLWGFFSLQEILWQTVRHGTPLHTVLFSLGALAVLLTALYTFRLLSVIFGGSESGAGDGEVLRDAGLALRLPVALLAPPAALLGFFAPSAVLLHAGQWPFLLLGAGLIGLGAWAGWRLDRKRPAWADRASLALGPPFRGRLFLDEASSLLLVAPLRLLSRGSALLDRALFDGLAEGAGASCDEAGETLGRIQDGRISTYAAWFAAGVVALGLIVLVGVLR